MSKPKMMSQVKNVFSSFSCHKSKKQHPGDLLTDPFPENLIAPSPLQASLTARVEPSILTKFEASFSVFPAEVFLIWNLGPGSSLAPLSLEAGCKITSQHLSCQISSQDPVTLSASHFLQIHIVLFGRLFPD